MAFGGGLLTAALTSVAYAPHILMDWSDNVPYAVNQYASLVMSPAWGTRSAHAASPCCLVSHSSQGQMSEIRRNPVFCVPRTGWA